VVAAARLGLESVSMIVRKPWFLPLLAVTVFSQCAFGQAARLEEVIVTAEKRVTTVQDTPIAVTAFTGEELLRALISKPMDLQFSVPNMLMSKGKFLRCRYFNSRHRQPRGGFGLGQRHRQPLQRRVSQQWPHI
jgi:hypothetical protein